MVYVCDMQYHCYGELTSAVPLLPQSQRAHEGLESLFHNLIFHQFTEGHS